MHELLQACAKLLSDRVKKENIAIPPAECVSVRGASLYGTMCPPVPGWDTIVETHLLAQGGREEHGLLVEDGSGFSTSNFLDAIHRLASMPPRDRPDTRTFKQWLWDEEWVQSGA